MSDFYRAMGFRADNFPVYHVTVRLDDGSTKLFKTSAKNPYDAELKAKTHFGLGAKVVKVEEKK